MAQTKTQIKIKPQEHPGAEANAPAHPSAPSWVQFQALVREWKRASGAMSSISGMSTLTPYRRIIAMGEAAVPWILAQLRAEGEEPDQWFWALQAITGVNPVKPEDQGDFPAMAKAWIQWGKRHGHAG
jgi:hypothetical protein